jgi:hypothetical protein
MCRFGRWIERGDGWGRGGLVKSMCWTGLMVYLGYRMRKELW